MITKEQIAKAKKEVVLKDEAPHAHDECIRIAYEWLDAQKKTKKSSSISRPLKHLIENWAGRYISQSDVEIAAHLHPDIFGKYSRYNISSRLTEPSLDRLKHIENIGAPLTQEGYREFHRPDDYKLQE
ncbi:hypothetical protein ACUUL3_07000 [Thiovibrio sp. JS02]